EPIRAIPNPASPADRKDQEAIKINGGPLHTITASHNDGAIDYIKYGGGGTVFEVPIYVPKTGTVRCQVKVYDLAGNLVNSGETNDAATGTLRTNEGYTKMHIYWSGYNSKDMKAAPGSYRMVVFISYKNTTDSLAKNKKMQGSVGIAK
ncbi:MAG: hypothetical protein FWC04_07290, partial [Chitinispirillia bacterium]|nr:hypothetical protein [Chitinispirillia bacterium]